MKLIGNLKFRTKFVLLNLSIVTIATACVTLVALNAFQKETMRQLSKDQESRIKTLREMLAQKGNDFRVADGDLLVAAPAFGLGWQAGGRAAQSARMAHQALDAQTDVHVMWELNGLSGRYLGLIDPPHHSYKKQHDNQYQTGLNQRLFQE